MSFVQGALGTNSGSGIAASASATFGSAVGIGDAVLVAVGGFTWTGTVSGASVTDDKSNIYTQLQARSDGSAAVALYVFYSLNIINQPSTITFSAGTNNTLINLQVLAQDYNTVSSINGSLSNSQFQPGSGANAITTGNLLTTANGCTIWGVCVNGFPAVGTITSGTGYTLRTQDTTFGNAGLISEDLSQSVSGSIAATFTDTGSGTTNRYTSAIVALGGKQLIIDKPNQIEVANNLEKEDMGVSVEFAKSQRCDYVNPWESLKSQGPDNYSPIEYRSICYSDSPDGIEWQKGVVSDPRTPIDVLSLTSRIFTTDSIFRMESLLTLIAGCPGYSVLSIGGGDVLSIGGGNVLAIGGVGCGGSPIEFLSAVKPDITEPIESGAALFVVSDFVVPIEFAKGLFIVTDTQAPLEIIGKLGLDNAFRNEWFFSEVIDIIVPIELLTAYRPSSSDGLWMLESVGKTFTDVRPINEWLSGKYIDSTISLDYLSKDINDSLISLSINKIIRLDTRLPTENQSFVTVVTLDSLLPLETRLGIRRDSLLPIEQAVSAFSITKDSLLSLEILASILKDYPTSLELLIFNRMDQSLLSEVQTQIRKDYINPLDVLLSLNRDGNTIIEFGFGQLGINNTNIIGEVLASARSDNISSLEVRGGLFSDSLYLLDNTTNLVRDDRPPLSFLSNQRRDQAILPEALISTGFITGVPIETIGNIFSTLLASIEVVNLQLTDQRFLDSWTLAAATNSPTQIEFLKRGVINSSALLEFTGQAVTKVADVGMPIEINLTVRIDNKNPIETTQYINNIISTALEFGGIPLTILLSSIGRLSRGIKVRIARPRKRWNLPT